MTDSISLGEEAPSRVNPFNSIVSEWLGDRTNDMILEVLGSGEAYAYSPRFPLFDYCGGCLGQALKSIMVRKEMKEFA